jgi:hypothetical protein
MRCSVSPIDWCFQLVWKQSTCLRRGHLATNVINQSLSLCARSDHTNNNAICRTLVKVSHVCHKTSVLLPVSKIQVKQEYKYSSESKDEVVPVHAIKTYEEVEV